MTDREEQKTVLLTLGRLPVALEVARSFATLGWTVVVAEPYGMHLARMSNSVSRTFRTRQPKEDREGYLEDLRNIIEREQISLVVPISEESMHVAALKETLKDVEFFCPDQPRILNLHDKLKFNRLAERFGLSVPVTCGGNDEAAKELSAGSDYIVKPRLGSSGRGVRYYAQGVQLLRSDEASDKVLLQQRIQGTELSSFSVAKAGVLSGTVVYASRASSGSVAVAFERIQHLAIERWVEKFVAETKHTGFIAFDFMVNDLDVPYAIECNPRATSGIHFFASTDLAKAIVSEESVPIQLRKDRLLQEFYSNFTALLGSLFRPAEFRRRFKLLVQANDVTWSTHDPWPFLLMTINTWKLIALALVKRKTFAEVAVLDIEWSRD